MKVLAITGALLVVCAACGTTQSAYADDTTTGTGNELIQYCNQHEYGMHSVFWTVCEYEVYGVSTGYEYGTTVGYLRALKDTNQKAPSKLSHHTAFHKMLLENKLHWLLLNI